MYIITKEEVFQHSISQWFNLCSVFVVVFLLFVHFIDLKIALRCHNHYVRGHRRSKLPFNFDALLTSSDTGTERLARRDQLSACQQKNHFIFTVKQHNNGCVGESRRLVWRLHSHSCRCLQTAKFRGRSEYGHAEFEEICHSVEESLLTRWVPLQADWMSFKPCEESIEPCRNMTNLRIVLLKFLFFFHLDPATTVNVDRSVPVG